MLKVWTLMRRPAGGRTITLAASLLAVLACDSGSNDRNANQIRPIRASLAINPVPDDPAVYFVQNSVSGDLVLLDVRLRSSAAVTFDAFTLEVHFDPGILQTGGSLSSQPFIATPFVDGSGGRLDCNQQVGICTRSGTPFSCVKVQDCISPDTFSGPSNNPFCEFDSTVAPGTFVMGAAITDDSVAGGCPASITTLPGGDIKLFTLGFVAASIGTSRVELIQDPTPGTTGDCEILLGGLDQGIPCFDGNATITATR